MRAKALGFGLLATGAACFSVGAAAQADAPVTRTLQQEISVPSGDSVSVENLVGHMRVVQGSGPVKVAATVNARGSDAAALARSVKLEVATIGNDVRVHVFYPVARYDTYLYSPPGSTNGSGETCILGKLICFHGHSNSTITYQGKRVHVQQSSDGASGVPLYVDVTVTVPANLHAQLSNAVGVLEATGLTDNLGLAAQGGDIHVRDVRGELDVATDGGDVALNNVSVANAKVATDGGDVAGAGLAGDLRIATDGGDVNLGSVSGRLSVESDGGDIRLDGSLATLQSLDGTTAGGDLTVSAALPALRSLNASSGGGDVLIRTSRLSMHLDAATDGGDLHVELPDMRNVHAGSHHLSGDIGQGAGSGTLHSGGGDITVTRL